MSVGASSVSVTAEKESGDDWEASTSSNVISWAESGKSLVSSFSRIWNVIRLSSVVVCKSNINVIVIVFMEKFLNY